MQPKNGEWRQPTNHLIWVIWLVAGLFFYYVISDTFHSYRDTLKRSRNDALAQARLVAEHASNTINFADLVLLEAVDVLSDTDLKRGLQLTPERREQINARLKNLQSRVRGVVSISVTDAEGIVFSNSLGIAPGISLASRAYFKAVQQQAQSGPVISEAVLGRVSNKWGIQVARRLEFKDGRFAGMLVANLGIAESFDAFYESLTTGKRDAIALYDTESRLVSRFPRADHLLGKPLPRNSVSDAFKSLVPEGVIEQQSVVDGETRLFAFKQVPRYPLYALVAPIKSDVLSAWSRERDINAIYATLALAAALYLTYLIRNGARSVMELQNFRNHLEAIANGGTALIWTSNRDMLCDYFNETWLRFTGRTFEQEYGNGWTEGVHPEDYERCLNIYTSHFKERSVFEMEYRLRNASGEYRWILDQGNPRFSVTGEFIGYIGFCYDITDRVRADEQIRQAASVFSHTREGILICGADTRVVNVNRAFLDITGYTADQVIGQLPSLLNSDQQTPDFYASMWAALNSKGQWHGEVWDRRSSGDPYAAALTVSLVRDAQGQTEHIVMLFSDVTELRLHQKQLEQLANFDTLTNLPNRLLLADRLRQGMVHAERRERKVAVAYLDLDGFKTVNDLHGHAVGDRLLIKVSERLSHCLREGDTLARLGGDEFVAVLTDLESEEGAIPVVERLLKAANQPVNVDGHELQVSASIGVTYFPQASDADAEQLLRQADQAMYEAKLAGKNRLAVFDAENDQTVRGHNARLERIRQALTTEEFVLYYQPKVNMRTREFIGVEALIRWQHPEEGLLAPGQFLPWIERHRLSVNLGEWVIRTALKQLAAWQLTGKLVPISVNVGAMQLQQSNFFERLRALLAEFPQVPPHSLQLEILETSALEDIGQVSQFINRCAELGVSFALDDFGTGYSSLTYLKRLPIPTVKIDQSFVRDMLVDRANRSILDGVLWIMRELDRSVVAEGVETLAHGRSLMDLGCELAQGYGIGYPMPSDSLPQWLERWKADTDWSDVAHVVRPPSKP